jgi:uncharacterized SAM-binding protein YcdF (DUF218 family)
MEKILHNKWFRFFLILILILLLLFQMRYLFLKWVGNFLIEEDAVEKCDAIFVLSGNALDRATEAASLYQQGISKKIICTGENQSGDFEVMHLTQTESDISKLRLTDLGVPDTDVLVIHRGTSTMEEGKIIYTYCMIHHLKSCMVLSSKFHTRRINFVLGKYFKNTNTKLLVHGATPSKFNLNQWWKSEEGLMSVYDEYIKLVYYFIKY